MKLLFIEMISINKIFISSTIIHFYKNYCYKFFWFFFYFIGSCFSIFLNGGC